MFNFFSNLLPHVSLPQHILAVKTTVLTTYDAACFTHMTPWLPGRWGFLAQKGMWLAEPGKELLNGSKQSSVSTEVVWVCVSLSVWLCIQTSKKMSSPSCTYSADQKASVIIKASTHPICVFFLLSGSHVFRYFISFLVFLHFLSLLTRGCNPSVFAGTMEANTDPKWLDYELLSRAFKNGESTSERWRNVLSYCCWNNWPWKLMLSVSETTDHTPCMNRK